MSGSKRIIEILLFIINAVLLSFLANSFFVLRENPFLIPLFLILLPLCNIIPLFSNRKFPDIKIRVCNHGNKCLSLFLISMLFSCGYQTVIAFFYIPDRWIEWAFGLLLCIVTEAIMFWNGIICVYCSSVQLGIKLRIIGIICGFIPIANFIVLIKIIYTVKKEVDFETEKFKIDSERADLKICATKYPLLLVHGVFFRDTRFFNYWGRIPGELEKNGAKIYYGEHQSASSIKESAEELAIRIKEIVDESGCEKLNIVAHSKGGLDCIYAISKLGIAPYVASVTTINTPHRGCMFADYLLTKAPDSLKHQLEKAYNSAMKKLGDKNPDFLAAAYDLTSEHSQLISQDLSIPDNIFCRSVGSKLNHASGGKFPLNFSYLLAKHFDGPNDGLVGEASFKFGDNYTFLTVKGRRGISHGDMIDLNRENIPGFDVREFYVNLTAELKNCGL